MASTLTRSERFKRRWCWVRLHKDGGMLDTIGTFPVCFVKYRCSRCHYEFWELWGTTYQLHEDEVEMERILKPMLVQKI